MNLNQFEAKAKTLPTMVTANIPDFGALLIRILTPAQRNAEYIEWLRPQGKTIDARLALKDYRLVAICLLATDENGDPAGPMFSDENHAAEVFQNIPGLWTSVFEAILRANRMTDESAAVFEKK